MFEPSAHEINAAIISNDVKELHTECWELVNDPEFPIRISPWDLFCQKTGHRVGVRDEGSLFALIKICGRDVASNIYNCTSLNVHPAWLHTDPESLDSLMESDPIGYAVYCLALITAQHYQTRKNTNPKLYPEADRYWSLARANALLSQQGVGGIEQLNTELARMVSFMPDATNYFFAAIRKFGNTPDKLAMLHCTGELTGLLHDAINNTLNSIGAGRQYAAAWIKRTRFIDIAATPEDAARGPTNVRKQRVSQKKIAEAALFGELQKLFGESGLDREIQADNLVGSTAWHAKMAARRSAQEQRDAEIARELAALVDITNLAMPETFNEDDDYSVEVRKLAIEKTNGEFSTGQRFEQQPEPQSEQQLQTQPPVKLTGLALLRALRKKEI